MLNLEIMVPSITCRENGLRDVGYHVVERLVDSPVCKVTDTPRHFSILGCI